MDFISNREPQIKEMLKIIGVDSIDDLFKQIPESLRRPAPKKDDGLSEFECMRLIDGLSAKNMAPSFENYLGAGAYEHHIPAVVGSICQKSEFLTAYTPYQPEASQGILQATFEYQSAICALTGLDVSNASLYDGASACAEALLMALRINKGRNKIVVTQSLHPYYSAICDQYLKSHEIEIVAIPFLENGSIDVAKFELVVDSSVAAVLVQSPNFLGYMEPVKLLAEVAKKVGALTILCANPLAYGLFSSAAELGVDIAVGDCQPLGLPLEFGGPYVGYIACREEYLRQLPGRIVGETKDTQGRRGFVLTLQAREQHIRREKATSNICTNQALAALATLITMLWYGKEGLHQLALTNYQRAAYLKDQLSKISGVTINENAAHFNEFVVKFPVNEADAESHFYRHKILPGIPLSRFYPELSESFLVAVTETKSLEQLDRYIAAAKELSI